MFTKAKVGTVDVLALAPLSILPEYQKKTMVPDTINFLSVFYSLFAKGVCPLLHNVKRTSVGTVPTPYENPIVRSGSQRNHGLHMPHLA